MKNLLIAYPKCNTCQKAKKWLEDRHVAFEERHIVEQNPTKKELQEWVKASGGETKKWFNTSGLKYKELDLKTKLPSMSEEEKIALLATDGMLVKRPILVTDKGVCAGFREEEWEKLVK